MRVIIKVGHYKRTILIIVELNKKKKCEKEKLVADGPLIPVDRSLLIRDGDLVF